MVGKLVMLSCAALGLHAADEIPAFRHGARILFQGDSITDGNRGRSADPNHILGHGYAFLIAAKYGALLPERELTFLNRGISGNTVADLAARWQKDTVELKPDLLSVLIGINDASRNVPLEAFEKGYDQLLADAVAANPKVRLVLCEPFSLASGKHRDGPPEWWEDVKARQRIVARLAEKYQAALVHYQRVFDAAAKRAPAEYWIWDGIHPTYSGHQLMAEEWVRTVQQYWND